LSVINKLAFGTKTKVGNQRWGNQAGATSHLLFTP